MGISLVWQGSKVLGSEVQGSKVLGSEVQGSKVLGSGFRVYIVD